MDAITIICPACKAELEIEGVQPNMSFPCPSCQKQLRITAKPCKKETAPDLDSIHYRKALWTVWPIIKKGVEDVLNQTKRASLNGKTMYPDDLMIEVKRFVEKEGIQTGPKGSAQDLSTVFGCRLLVETNIAMATGYATWKQGQDQLLDTFPAQRFIRVMFNEKPRDNWPQRWRAAANEVGYEGVSRRGMVALKTSPIWEALSKFGTPWPPFDWGSGMGLEDVSFDDAVKLGLIAEGDELKPLVDKFNFDLIAESLINQWYLVESDDVGSTEEDPLENEDEDN